jgi:thiol-disulfide isomerase/thioredoxin
MGANEEIFDFLSNNPELRANMGLYNPDREILGKIKENIEDVEIKLFTASWCPDCRIQLPRFFSVLLALEDEDFALEIITVDRSKRDDSGLAKLMCVMAIPTVIFLRNGKELGRIIERPKGRMEGDILEIVGGNQT